MMMNNEYKLENSESENEEDNFSPVIYEKFKDVISKIQNITESVFTSQSDYFIKSDSYNCILEGDSCTNEIFYNGEYINAQLFLDMNNGKKEYMSGIMCVKIYVGNVNSCIDLVNNKCLNELSDNDVNVIDLSQLYDTEFYAEFVSGFNMKSWRGKICELSSVCDIGI